MPSPPKASVDNDATLAVNRRAYHDYFIEETYEAGLVLTGTEIKSLRQGQPARGLCPATPGGDLAAQRPYLALRAGQPP